MPVTVRLDGPTASAFDEIVDRVDRTAVWVASEAIIHAARAMSTSSRPLEGYFGRQKSTRRLLIAVDEHVSTMLDGLAVAHTVGATTPSAHAIARASIQRLINVHGGTDGAVAYLGETRPTSRSEATS